MEDDTIKLLKECNAGVKTAVTSIDEVMDSVSDEKMRKLLLECKEKHEKLGNETHVLLNRYHDDEKDPSPMVKMMSWMKINVKLMQDPSDSVVADLMTDGANMGVKSLAKYLNEYENAEAKVKGIAQELIDLERKLCEDMRAYL